MKKMFFTAVWVWIFADAHAQTFSEWTRQHHTQIRYALRQIALLQQQDGLLNQGYALLQAGLGRMDTLKQADFAQHDAFFQSLLHMKPAIARWRMIVDCREKIARTIQRTVGKTGAVYESVRELCADFHREWLALTGSVLYALPDEERIERLNALCMKVDNTYRFITTQRYGDDIFLLQQEKEAADVKGLKKIHSK